MSRRSISMPVALLAAVAALPGCVTAHRSLQGPIQTLVAGDLPRSVRVTKADSTQVTLYGPQLNGDTLIGWNDVESSARRGARFLIRVAVRDIVRIDHPETNWVASLGVGLLLLLVVGLVAGAAAGGSYGGVSGMNWPAF